METSKTLVFDGSFQGFLSAVFHSFEHRVSVLDIRTAEKRQRALFGDTLVCATEPAKARMVWDTLEKKGYKAARNIYFAFLSEQEGVALLIYRYIQSLLKEMESDRAQTHAELQAKIETLATAVAQEKRKVEMNLHLRPGQGNTGVAILEPRYNVLPLVTRNCRTRFPDRSWLLCDRRRQYGLYYHQGKMELLPIRLTEIALVVPDRHLQISLAETGLPEQLASHPQWQGAAIKYNAA